MSVRACRISDVLVSGSGAPQVGVTVTATLQVPAGAQAVDSSGEIIDLTPLTALTDGTGTYTFDPAASPTNGLIAPGDIYQNPSGTLVALGGCTWKITYLSTTIVSPSFAYSASTIHPSSWVPSLPTLGLLRMDLTDVLGSGAAVQGGTFQIGVSQQAVWSGGAGTGQVVAGAFSVATDASGRIYAYLVRSAELNPSGTPYTLLNTSPGAQQSGPWTFTCPAVYTQDKGVYAGGTTYALNDVVRRAADDVPFISLANGNVGNPLTDAAHWAAYAGETITSYLIPVSPPGQLAYGPKALAHDTNVPALADDPVASPTNQDDDLHNLASHRWAKRAVAGSFTVNNVTDDVIFCDASGGVATGTLCAASARVRPLIVKKVDSSTNAVNLTRVGADTVDGATTYALTAQNQAVMLLPKADGSGWLVVGTNSASAGTVTSVAMTVPAWMAVTGSPITGAGTLALTVSGTVPTANLPVMSNTALGIGRPDGTSLVATGGVLSATGSTTDATPTTVGVVEIDQSPPSGHPVAVARLANQRGSYNATAQPWLAVDPDSLLDRLRGRSQVGQLTGDLQEFDLQYYAGNYYLAYHAGGGTSLKGPSPTVAALFSSGVVQTINTLYPSLLFDGTTWHVWGWSSGTGKLQHWTSATFAGAYTNVDNPNFLYYDPQVRQNPADGLYYMGYTSGSPTGKVGILRSSDLVTWSDLGNIFATIGDPPACPDQFDPTPAFWGGRAFLLFSGGASSASGKIWVVELDPSNNMNAVSTAVMLADSVETWAGSAGANNPIFLAHPSQPGQERVYYVTSTGTSYLQAGNAPPDGRRPADLLRLSSATGTDAATGLPATLHGGVAPTPAGLVCTTTPSGAYGTPGQPNLADFTMAVLVSLASLPAAGNGLLLRVSTANESVPPLAALYVSSAGALVGSVQQNSGVGNLTLTGTTTLATGTIYRALLRKLGTEVRLYLNGHLEATGTHSGSLTGLTEWSVANDKGATQAAGEQAVCTIFGAVICGEALPLGVDPFAGLAGAGGGGGAGATALSGLSDVQLTSPAAGQELTYNGTRWVNSSPIIGYAPMVNGDLPGPSPIATADGQFLMVPMS